LSYYTRGVPDWKWRFPYHYGPFACSLAEHISDFKFSEYTKNLPTTPFLQLLCVLPPESANLLPEPLDKFLTSSDSIMAEYCPAEIEIDMAGKKNDYEGIVLLPMIDYTKVEKSYAKLIRKVNDVDMKRNILGKDYLYKKTDKIYFFKSFYGNIECSVNCNLIEF
jgi:5'-3' exonuclease